MLIHLLPKLALSGEVPTGRQLFPMPRPMMNVGFESSSTKQVCIRTFTMPRTHASVLVAQLEAKLGVDSASYEAAKAEALTFLQERIVLKWMFAIGLCSGL